MKICSLVLLILDAFAVGNAVGNGQWDWTSTLKTIFGVCWAFIVWGYMKEGSDGR